MRQRTGIFDRKNGVIPMLAYTYISPGKFELIDKPKPKLQGPRDAIVRITLGSICTSDLHIKHGSVPRAVPGITVGHEMVGVVEEVGSEVQNVKPGDREYLTKNEAKKEYKNKPDNVEFEIPTTVPPLTDAIKQLVERATAEKRKL